MDRLNLREPFPVLIDTMIRWGSSLTLNWGEDTGMWEVAWIVDGVRCIGVTQHWDMALRMAGADAIGKGIIQGTPEPGHVANVTAICPDCRKPFLTAAPVDPAARCPRPHEQGGPPAPPAKPNREDTTNA